MRRVPAAIAVKRCHALVRSVHAAILFCPLCVFVFSVFGGFCNRWRQIRRLGFVLSACTQAAGTAACIAGTCVLNFRCMQCKGSVLCVCAVYALCVRVVCAICALRVRAVRALSACCVHAAYARLYGVQCSGLSHTIAAFFLIC